MKKIFGLILAFSLSISPVLAETCNVQSHFTPREKMQGFIIQELQHAKTSIHASLYGVTNQPIVNTLIALKKANPNLDIQVCLDNRQSRVRGSQVKALADAGIKVYIKKSVLLDHDKYVVIDSTEVITGSWNWSYSAEHQNNVDTFITNCATDSEYKKYEDDFVFIRDTMSSPYVGQ
jgi:phosphatidylserine/phosphatidylglycerophosphate/cardiolipin synthase-like enzyme